MAEPRPIGVLASVIIDDVVLPDGPSRQHVLGGAGTYSAIGAASWWPSVAVVAGIGTDTAELIERHFSRLGLRLEGLLRRGEYTIRNRLVYRRDGTRTETPMLGATHFESMQATASDVPDALLPAAGTYLFCGLSAEFWAAFDQRRALLGTTLWELHGTAATSESWPFVRTRLPAADIFSLNLEEADGLLGLEPQGIVDRLLDAGARIVVLRMGEKGALIADGRIELRVWPPAYDVVDVTGAGNTFCGGFLGAWCRSGDLEYSARAAAAAAAQCVATWGPPERIDPMALEALAQATRVEKLR